MTKRVFPLRLVHLTFSPCHSDFFDATLRLRRGNPLRRVTLTYPTQRMGILSDLFGGNAT